MLAKIELPWPPTVNTYWRHTTHPKTKRPLVYVTKQGKSYRETVVKLCGVAGLGRLKYAGRVSASYECFPPDNRVRDLSNILKCLEDSLVDAGVIVDDGQINEFQMVRAPVEKFGRVIVTLTAMENRDDE